MGGGSRSSELGGVISVLLERYPSVSVLPLSSSSESVFDGVRDTKSLRLSASLMEANDSGKSIEECDRAEAWSTDGLCRSVRVSVVFEGVIGIDGVRPAKILEKFPRLTGLGSGVYVRDEE
jgi:hypothetical protein